MLLIFYQHLCFCFMIICSCIMFRISERDVFWFILVIITQSQSYSKDKFTFSGHLNDFDSSFYDNIANMTTPSDVLRFHFNVSFPIPWNNKCPILYIHHPENNNGYDMARGCFNKYQIQKNTQFDKHYWHFANCGTLLRNLIADQCKIDKEQGLVFCEDVLEIANGFKTEWFVAAGYMCGEEQPLDFVYNMSFEKMDHVNCHTFDLTDDMQSQCKQFYDFYATPNLMAYNLENIQLAYSLSVKVFIGANCYQHFLELTCRTVYPQCDNETKLIINSPCRQTCFDWISGCQHIVPIFTYCRLYADSLDPTVCLYKNATCTKPPIPNNGTCSNISEVSLAGSVLLYECDNGYDLHGESKITCLYNGNWSHSVPKCLFHEHKVDIEIIPLVILILFSVIIISCIILYRKFRLEVKAIIKNGFACRSLCNSDKNITNPLAIRIFNIVKGKVSYGTFQKKTYHAVILSSDDDSVHCTFMDNLRNNIPNVLLFTDSDVMPGQLEMNKRTEALYDSYAFIVLLSQSTINLNHFEQIFQFAQEVHGCFSGFKFIIIKMDKYSNLSNIPPNIVRYIKCGCKFDFVYEIDIKNPLLWKMIKTILLDSC